ncbi:hypothetical protein SDC9_200539 [bioreactor metagenome]|uniref:Uncharacterized protein n=1 Tax=bioreactor metagenome TaxID=1076179 RepID=A0A645IP92_9ZZZZ
MTPVTRRRTPDTSLESGDRSLVTKIIRYETTNPIYDEYHPFGIV